VLARFIVSSSSVVVGMSARSGCAGACSETASRSAELLPALGQRCDAGENIRATRTLPASSSTSTAA
jgi:hypothetical protein